MFITCRKNQGVMIKLVFRNLIWQQCKILPKISGKILKLLGGLLFWVH